MLRKQQQYATRYLTFIHNCTMNGIQQKYIIAHDANIMLKRFLKRHDAEAMIQDPRCWAIQVFSPTPKHRIAIVQF